MISGNSFRGLLKTQNGQIFCEKLSWSIHEHYKEDSKLAAISMTRIPHVIKEQFHHDAKTPKTLLKISEVNNTWVLNQSRKMLPINRLLQEENLRCNWKRKCIELWNICWIIQLKLYYKSKLLWNAYSRHSSSSV